MTNEEKKLYLLDAFALIYRSYYAFINNPRITTTGINTSATFGFFNFAGNSGVGEADTSGCCF